MSLIRPIFLGLAVIAATGDAAPAQSQDGGTDLRTLTQRCDGGDRAACSRAGLLLSDPDRPEFDIFLSLRFLQQGCQAQDAAACGRLALIYFEGSDEVESDSEMAGNFARQACARQDRTGCEVAEAIFGDAGSPRFDAALALRYRRINCDYGQWQSCHHLARIYYNLEEFIPAEQVAAQACGPGGADRKAVCDFAGALKQRRERQERAIAEQRARHQQAIAARERASAVMRNFLDQGDYDGAVYAAIYHSRSVRDAEQALQATHRAGAMGRLFKDHLYVLDYWFPSGPLNQIVNAELRARSRANDCGIFNCTNTPGASSRRWNAQNGSGAGHRRSVSNAPTFQPPRVRSVAEIQRDTRNRYRTAHCTMNNNANRYLCR